ncbi:MAG: TRAP transporter small permease [Rhizobiaceae bacterium]|nr:TRAP transporter small permease [Rhizobiaceae bacterium]
MTSDDIRSARPTSLLGLVYAVVEFVVSLCMAVAGAMLVLLIVTMGWLVFGRYVLNDTPTWVEQLSLMLVVWISFLGAAAGIWRKGHLGVDFIRDAMPPVTQHVLRAIANLMVLGFAIAMAWQGYLLAGKTWTRQIPMLQISEGWRAVPMSLCGALVSIFVIVHLLEQVRELKGLPPRPVE